MALAIRPTTATQLAGALHAIDVAFKAIGDALDALAVDLAIDLHDACDVAGVDLPGALDRSDELAGAADDALDVIERADFLEQR